jgi:hypothetical protein
MKRVASLSSRYNSSKTQPFGIHFDIGFCRPIPSNVNASGIASKHQESYLYMRSKTVGCCEFHYYIFHHEHFSVLFRKGKD